MRPWPELPGLLKDANIAQAVHLGTKLDAIGCVLIPESGLVPEFAFAAGEIEHLAQLEHERWMHERAEHGIGYGSARDDKHHPDMVEWARLDENAKEKDRDVIRNLPGIVRQAGFEIMRLDSPTSRQT